MKFVDRRDPIAFRALVIRAGLHEVDERIRSNAESLLGQRQATLQQVFRFLEVDDGFYTDQFSKMQHRSSFKRRKTWLGQQIEGAFGARLERALPYRMRWYVRLLLYWPLSQPIPRPALSKDRRAQLQLALQEDVDRLRAYTGLSLVNWSV